MTNAPIAPAKILSLVDASEPLSPRAAAILRGVQRMMRIHAFESLAEVPLPNGRRADVLAVSTKGEFSIVEIKSSIADFRSDLKWPSYREYCDRLYFAVATDFPIEILPETTGIILADAFGGEIVRDAPVEPIAAARRKALTLLYARCAAMRLQTMCDPGFDPRATQG